LACLPLVINSCIKGYTEPKEVSCPVPPVCSPDIYSGGKIIPTGISTADENGEYFVLKNVNANTPQNEWHISFAMDDRWSYVTRRENQGANQRLSVYSGSAVNNLSYQYIVSGKTKYNYGMPFTAPDGEDYVSISISKASLRPDKNGYYTVDTLPGLSYLAKYDRSSGHVQFKKLNRVFNSEETNYWVSHFQLAFAGDYVFFASDIEGGYGGTDLYYAKWNNGDVGKPINMGPSINTPCNELSPYYDPYIKKMIFSSSGHRNIGGFDLFSASVSLEGEKLLFSSPDNLGKPINSEHNELFPSSENPEKRRVLYFTSDRPGGKGGYDLYAFFKKRISEQEDEIIIDRAAATDIEPEGGDDVDGFAESDLEISIASEEKDTVSLVLKGKVEDELGKPVSNAVITAKELETYKQLDTTNSAVDGSFEIEVATTSDIEVTAQSENDFYKSERVSLVGKQSGDSVKLNLILPSQIFLRINFPNDVADDPYDFVLDSMGIETDERWTTSISRLAEHIKRFYERIEYIELIGHTDTKGTLSYNMDLGHRRSNFIKRELIKLGVSSEILRVSSAGETRLLSRLDGETVDSYERRLRRVEINKVIKEVK